MEEISIRSIWQKRVFRISKPTTVNNWKTANNPREMNWELQATERQYERQIGSRKSWTRNSPKADTFTKPTPTNSTPPSSPNTLKPFIPTLNQSLTTTNPSSRETTTNPQSSPQPIKHNRMTKRNPSCTNPSWLNTTSHKNSFKSIRKISKHSSILLPINSTWLPTSLTFPMTKTNNKPLSIPHQTANKAWILLFVSMDWTSQTFYWV